MLSVVRTSFVAAGQGLLGEPASPRAEEAPCEPVLWVRRRRVGVAFESATTMGSVVDSLNPNRSSQFSSSSDSGRARGAECVAR